MKPLLGNHSDSGSFYFICYPYNYSMLSSAQLFIIAISLAYPASSFGVSKINSLPASNGCVTILFNASAPISPSPIF